MSLKKQAEECLRQNRLGEARQLYQKVCRNDRGDIDALFFLGVINGQLDMLPDSESCFREVVARNPEYYPAWDNLGTALMLQHKDVEAEACFRESIKLNPNSSQAYNNLGNLLCRTHKTSAAYDCYQKAISLNPGYAEAYNNLGNLYLEQEKVAEAHSCYGRALELNPQYADACINYGKALHKSGRSDEGLVLLQRAAQLQPGNMEIFRSLSFIFSEINRLDDAASNAYKVLQVEPDDVTLLPRESVLLVMQRIPGFSLLLDRATGGGLGAVEEGLLEGEGRALFESRFFQSALQKMTLTSVNIERLLIVLRHLCLHAVMRGKNNSFELLFGKETAFLSALAMQCFNNDYVYYISDEEDTLLKGLEAKLDKLVAMDIENSVSFQRMLIVFGMYRPLYMLGCANVLMALDHARLPRMLQAVIRQQLVEPVEEENIRTNIISLTDITDATSLAVGQQYDEAPYPRWQSLATIASRPWKAVLASVLGDVEFPQFPEGRINILIAGCGTGRHALSTASRYSDADVLAIDISINCLAFAQRKASELGFNDVMFRHADILKLQDMTERFHIIEAVGVLQTMQDPDGGLRALVECLHPDGLMHVGLYSKQARRHVTSASADFKSRGFTSKDEDVRRLRKEIMEMKEDSPVRKMALGIYDFYSLPECRNLYFLVHEVLHTIDDISAMLEQAGLEFVKFEIAGETAENCFKELFPDNHDMADLDAWKVVEERYPNTFIRMYNFICRRKQ